MNNVPVIIRRPKASPKLIINDVPVFANMRIVSQWRMADGVVLVYDNSANGDPKPIGLLIITPNGTQCQNAEVSPSGKRSTIRQAEDRARSLSGDMTGKPIGKKMEDCLPELELVGVTQTKKPKKRM